MLLRTSWLIVVILAGVQLVNSWDPAGNPPPTTAPSVNGSASSGFCPDFVSCAVGSIVNCPLACDAVNNPCKPSQLCCTGFCGCKICRDPVDVAPPKPKAGSCPPSKPQHDSGSSCVQRCGGDSFCSDNLKCCEDGCITECVMPLGTPQAAS
ncbi:WAP four-disulfide core domain protein 2-like isoform X2 [Paramacrobiotus metropolitanus]|uniref:WAP four-disulfide core domain protein 2-like isoform X2 n=1 Tax=Paramacrobiotus metropolitanus TaxID=2943436 RepID=UPI002445DF06|nr:WAP four-disulfide core domain protein 2-like isoform X2 [Paramacrobiotus metropolitanus]